jgi:tagaturonate reductase
VSRRVLQFGTSRFLQAHADLFVHEARQAGQEIGPITIVKTTQGGARDGRVRAFGAPEGYPVRVRGFDKGRLIDETHQVTSVARAMDAHADWLELVDIFSNSTDIVFSNTGDGGYLIDSEDAKRRPDTGEVPHNFPAKLLALLIRRYERGGAPLLMLPCELVSRNGDVLRALLVGLADQWGESVAFKRWLTHAVTICNTLVDRIVSEAIEPIGAVAEPYALWAIQRQPDLIEPFEHPNVVYTDDLEPYLRLKLHILNLGHTYIADFWSREARPARETVREIFADSAVRARLMSLFDDEILLGFAARGLEPEAQAYWDATIERFDNPFLDHRIADIFENHRVKVDRRAKEFVAWVRAVHPTLPLPRLEALIAAAGRLQDPSRPYTSFPRSLDIASITEPRNAGGEKEHKL